MGQAPSHGVILWISAQCALLSAVGLNGHAVLPAAVVELLCVRPFTATAAKNIS